MYKRLILLSFVFSPSGWPEGAADAAAALPEMPQTGSGDLSGNPQRRDFAEHDNPPLEAPPRDAVTTAISASDYFELGKAQRQAGSVNQAVLSLRKSIELLELVEPLTSEKFIGPLAELAEAHATLGAHEAAIELVQRAIAIERRSYGLFHEGQLALLDRLAESCEAVSDLAGVDYARRYSVRVVERLFGPKEPQIIPSLNKLANWLELTGRYAMAAELYTRIAQISSQESDGRSPGTVNALMGVGRSHRLAYVETPELVEHSLWGRPPGEKFDPVTGQRRAIAGPASRPGLDATARLDRQGEEALLRSLEILESVPEPPPELLAHALLEIGDWYQTDRRPELAANYYRRAWRLFEQRDDAESVNPLGVPRPMFYRLPAELRRNQALRFGRAAERRVEFRMRIGVNGDVSDLVRTGGDMTEGEGWQIARALSRATFSPRFENGEPVATPDFMLVETRFDTANNSQTDQADSEDR